MGGSGSASPQTWLIKGAVRGAWQAGAGRKGSSFKEGLVRQPVPACPARAQESAIDELEGCRLTVAREGNFAHPGPRVHGADRGAPLIATGRCGTGRTATPAAKPKGAVLPEGVSKLLIAFTSVAALL